MCGAKYDPIFLKDEIPVILSDKSTNRIIFVAAKFKKKLSTILHKKYTVWLCDFNVVTQGV